MCHKDCGEGVSLGFFFFSRWKDEEEGGLLTKVQRTAVEQHLAACLMLNHLVSCRVLHIFSKRSSYITLFTQVPSAENPRANYTNKKF